MSHIIGLFGNQVNQIFYNYILNGWEFSFSGIKIFMIDTKD